MSIKTRLQIKCDMFLFSRRHRLVMSEGRLPAFSPSPFEGFSSTPVKTSQEKNFLAAKCLDNGVVSDDEDTFSLLSPIYHDSFDSEEEELESSPEDAALRASPARCELPRTPSKQKSNAHAHPLGSPPLSAWEKWLLSKAKEDRLRLEKKAEEEWLLKEKEERQEREREQKKLVMEEKIHDWLKIKKEQERQEQLVKQKKEEEEMQKKQGKQKEIEQKAQQKYRDWLQKKNQEKLEKEKKEKVEAALKEEQDRQRRRKAEEKFKEWLMKTSNKTRASPKTHSHHLSPYDKLYASPSFCNPIPWKPIHVPPPETSPNKTSVTKPQWQKKTHQSPRSAFRQRNPCAAQFLYRR